MQTETDLETRTSTRILQRTVRSNREVKSLRLHHPGSSLLGSEGQSRMNAEFGTSWRWQRPTEDYIKKPISDEMGGGRAMGLKIKSIYMYRTIEPNIISKDSGYNSRCGYAWPIWERETRAPVSSNRKSSENIGYLFLTRCPLLTSGPA